jgi:pimeloyl-ACP methyl ester carboxylesterase
VSQTSVAGQAPATRVRLAHHVVTLDDGHRVGVYVGGHGVPLVFLHGLGLSGRTYVRLLSRLAGMGSWSSRSTRPAMAARPTCPAMPQTWRTASI